MKSTEKIHEIVEQMPPEDRKVMMQDLLNLREMILDEITATIANSKKLLRLFYKQNGAHYSRGKFREQ